MHRPLSETVRDGADAFVRLASLASSAEGIQWERSHRITPRDDTDRKAAGGHGDPTGDIALDPRRLELRQAVEDAALALDEATLAARTARVSLSAALADWHGEA